MNEVAKLELRWQAIQGELDRMPSRWVGSPSWNDRIRELQLVIAQWERARAG
jgi:hypothetical protein